MQVEWDAAKSLANQEKHGISFEEAAELFVSGAEYLMFYDHAHSIDEDRFVSIGPIRDGVVLVVWIEPDEDLIRIISARWATKREVVLYQNQVEQP